jgi:hypothetical protein
LIQTGVVDTIHKSERTSINQSLIMFMHRGIQAQSIKSALVLGLGVLCTALSTAVAATNDADPPPLRTAKDLYQLENLLKIELFMESDDWDKVRFSWRGTEQREVDGEWVTVHSDYEHQPGDIVINGVRVGNVGVRKKGLIGSLSSQRPSLKVKFNGW